VVRKVQICHLDGNWWCWICFVTGFGCVKWSL